MNTPSCYPRKICGFTLIETIITLSIACILLAIGVPSFKTVIQNNRMSAARNSITTQLNLARSEAVKRNTRVVLCPTTDGLDCKNTMVWNEGIIMFTDNNKSGHLEPGEELLRYINISSGSIRISTTTKRRKAAYDANGFSKGKNVTFTFCDTNNQINPKAVIVSNSGRARLSDTKSGGDPLDCS
jgi:type IV fimbrial biogenesis protein FimT